MSIDMIGSIANALWQTILMVLVATAIAVCCGLPLGVLLWSGKQNKNGKRSWWHRLLGGVVNAMRSIPFIILMVAIIPLTRLLVGTSIGTTAAIVPLSLSAIPFFARLTESAFAEVSVHLIEAAEAMGASPKQIIWRVLLPEAMSPLIRATTLTAVTLVGYSAMAGAIGGGGLGDLAIRYGYQRFEVSVMIVTVIVLILLVQGIQLIGDRVAEKIYHKK